MGLRILTVCLALIEDVSEKEKFEQLYWQYKDLMFYCAHKRLHIVVEGKQNFLLVKRVYGVDYEF